MSTTSTILANPTVTVNSVALTEQCTQASLVRSREALDVTTFGDDSRTRKGGLYDHELTLTFFMSYEATNVYATLKDLVGTQTTVTVQPAAGSPSATSPAFTLTNTYLESLPVLNMELGAMSTFEVVFSGGTYSVATS